MINEWQRYELCRLCCEQTTTNPCTAYHQYAYFPYNFPYIPPSAHKEILFNNQELL